MPSFQQVVETTKTLFVEVAKEEALPRGVVPQPQLFVLHQRLEPPMVANVVCRPYYPGSDAIAAIAALGNVADAIKGTHLIVAWEESDLRTSIYGPGDHPKGLTVLQADYIHRDPNLLTWHPFAVELDASQRAHIRWAQTSVTQDPSLPDPIEQLLARWRAGAINDAPAADHTMTTAQRDGYQIHLTK